MNKSLERNANLGRWSKMACGLWATESYPNRFEGGASTQSQAGMNCPLNLILLVVFLTACSVAAVAQEASSTSQPATDVRSQLRDVQAKESELHTRARQLDEDLKPENIERSLAGIGSTKPEELRELRRRQLSIERESVRKQLNLVTASRERLESAVRAADAAAYHQSAEGSTLPVDQTLRWQYSASPRWFVGTLSGLIAAIGIIVVITLVRRFR
ncbi:MAG: hypothetical protein ABR501_01280 [Pyrinomonadaceae bacterium]